MRLTLLGTADSAGIPVYGCYCACCQQAKAQKYLRRGKTSALLEIGEQKWLFDANVMDINQRESLSHLTGIFVTHFHMDHVSALFDLRWGIGSKIPVYCPPDRIGADDLYKHTGILEYIPIIPFQQYIFKDFSVTPVPLNHSKLCYGYVIESNNRCFVYLTDTYGLSDETLLFLKQKKPHYIFLDVAYVAYADDVSKRNHNDLAMLAEIASQFPNSQVVLIHVSHHVVNYLHAPNQSNALPSNCVLSKDQDLFE